MERLNIFLSLMLLLTMGLISSCDKPGSIGEDLVLLEDNKLNVTFTDTLTINAYSQTVDSVTTNKLKYNLLGSYYDNVFGTTTASIYTQMRLSQSNVDFGSNAVCDSVILTLKYKGFYGDTASEQTLRVYEVNEAMYPDSLYFSNDTLEVLPLQIGAQKVVFNPRDSIYYGTTPVEPHLRFYLDNSFGDKILAKSGQSELSDNESFQNFIKGIFITSDKAINKGGYAYFDLMSPLSIMSIYYHNDSDTLVYKFAINEFCSYFSAFNHYNYSDASLDFRSQVIEGDTSLGNQNLYVQSLGGVKTHFTFPTLGELTKDGPIAIHNAELLINVASGTNADDKPIYGLAVVKIDSTGSPQFINDYFEGSTYFGGDYNESNNNYKFNLNRYIQSVASGNEKQYGLDLVAKGASIYGNRLIIDGPKSNNRKFRLKLTYTRITN